jgi:hypothetical protein
MDLEINKIIISRNIEKCNFENMPLFCQGICMNNNICPYNTILNYPDIGFIQTEFGDYNSQCVKINEDPFINYDIIYSLDYNIIQNYYRLVCSKCYIELYKENKNKNKLIINNNSSKDIVYMDVGDTPKGICAGYNENLNKCYKPVVNRKLFCRNHLQQKVCGVNYFI